MIQPENGSFGTTLPSSKMAGNELVEHMCRSLELRLRAGELVRSESIFAEYPSLAEDPEQALDLIYTEFVARSELGGAPTVDEFVSRFPQWRKLLERQFQLAEVLDNTATKVEFSNATRVDGERAPVSDRRFHVGKLLARGGIGQVMLAVDTELNREVAVKELQSEFSENLEIRERFLREAEITGHLEHPGIVPIYGLGRDDQQRPFYAMRLVRGQSFQEAIEALHVKLYAQRLFHSVEFQKLLRRFLSVCETIGYAQSRGVIHRDIKPQNILLGPFGETLVVDWGLAKFIDSHETARERVVDDLVANESSAMPTDGVEQHQSSDISLVQKKVNRSVDLTQSAESLIGTPAYMSPEQANFHSKYVGTASDIYSLGATLFSLLTGQTRFGDSNVDETLVQVRRGSFPRPHDLNRRVPPPLEAICLKAMAQEPHDRYASPSQLAGDIEHWLADEPVSVYRETLIQRAARWGRRNRTPAILGLVCSVLVSAISTAAAVRINAERFRSDQERIEARRSSAHLAFDRAYQLAEQYEHGEAMHWFARALKDAPSEDRDLRRVILTNMSAARRHLLCRKGTFSHDRPIKAHVFSKDGKLLLTVDTGGLARVWNVDSMERMYEHHLEPPIPVAAASTNDGTFLIATAVKRTVAIHKLSSSSNELSESSVEVEHDNSVVYAEFSPDGQSFATGSRTVGPATLRVWQVSDGQMLSEQTTPCPIERFAFQPRGRFIAVVGKDGVVRLCDWMKKSSGFEPIASDRHCQRITFTHDGKGLILGTTSGAVLYWEVETNRVLEAARHTRTVAAVACSSNDEMVAAIWDNGFVRTWSMRDLLATSELLRLNGFASRCSFRPLSRQMLILTERQTATLWEIPDPRTNAIPINQKSVDAIEFSSDGTLAITGSRNGTARLRDGKTGISFGKIMSHQAAIERVAIRPDAAIVLTASADGTAKLWNAKDGSPHGQLLDHRKKPNAPVIVCCAAFSSDGRIVATGDNSGVVKLWNADTGELLREVDKTSGSTTSIVFCPNSECVLVGYSAPENGLRMWSTVSGELLWKAKHRGSVRSVAISSDGQVAVSASNDETARLWNVSTGEPHGEVMKHDGEVFFARFSRDNSLVVTGGYDATVRLWNASDGSPFGTPMKHEAIVADAAFSEDARRLLTGSYDKTARLWDVPTCLPLAAPLVHSENVVAVGLHPHGDLAITGKRWPLPSPLPDNPQLIARWVRLATHRSFDSGNNFQWLDPAVAADEANEFEALTGQPWSAWGSRNDDE